MLIQENIRYFGESGICREIGVFVLFYWAQKVNCAIFYAFSISGVCRFSINSQHNSQESQSKKVATGHLGHTRHMSHGSLGFQKSGRQGRDHYQQARPLILFSRIHNQSWTPRARIGGVIT